MANLFEIDRAIMDAMEKCVDPETGEIDGEIYTDLEALQMERTTKIENIACWIKNLKSDADELKAEAKAMSDRAKAKERKAESLTHYLVAVLDGQKFETARAAIGWRKSKAVHIEYGTQLPDEYIRRKITEEPDKAAIKAALVAGKHIEGCELVENNNITIK